MSAPIAIEPVEITRRSYRPHLMDDRQRAIMDQTAASVLANYLIFRQSLTAAMAAEHELCGSWSTLSDQAFVNIERGVESLVKSLSCQRVEWPALPPRLVVPPQQ